MGIRHGLFQRALVNIEPLIRALSIPWSFFLLGSGASYPYVPLMGDMKKIILTEASNVVRYLPNIHPRSPTGKRFFGTDYPDIPSGFIDTRVATLMAQTVSRCPNYQVFNFAVKPLTIFNMNTDGLARQYCRGHCVIEPHGSVPSNFINLFGPGLDGIYKSQLMFSRPKGLFTEGTLLPQREPIGISSKFEYKMAEYYFRYATYFVVIGYSFGRDGEVLDDHETFNFFKPLLRRRPKMPIILIDTNGEETAARIHEATKLNENIRIINAKWNVLSEAIICFARKRYYCNSRGKGTVGQQVQYLYDLIMSNYGENSGK